MQMLVFPVLHTPRLVLRKLTPEDVPALVKYAGNKKVSDFILNIPFPYYEHDAAMRVGYVHKGWKEGSRYVFAIEAKDRRELVGEVGVHLQGDAHSAQLAYWIGEPFWNQGWCTEAVEAVMAFVWKTLPVDEVHASCVLSNAGSVRVLEKLGFQQRQITGSIGHYAASRVPEQPG